MPLKLILAKSGTFDPKSVAILLEAFDGVVAELALREPAKKREGRQTHHPACARSDGLGC